MSRRRKRETSKRPPESYLAKDAEARARQLANLKPAPPAPPGNELARTHGGFASRVDPHRVDAKLAQLVAWLEEDPPLRASDGSLPREDRLLLELLARSLVRLADVSHWLTLHGVLDPKTGAPRPAVGLEGELRKEAAGLAVQLGMSPLSRARMGLDVAAAERLVAGDARDASLGAGGMLTDPAVRAANRELVRAAAAARDRELAERGGLGPPADDDVGDDAGGEPAVG